jgi:hypothetical protein
MLTSLEFGSLTKRGGPFSGVFGAVGEVRDTRQKHIPVLLMRKRGREFLDEGGWLGHLWFDSPPKGKKSGNAGL